MRILLTGATGFLGARLLPLLLAQSHSVVCAGRRPPPDPRADFVQADFGQDTEKSVWMSRLFGVEIVINAVGIFRESERQTFERLHTAAPRALFAACAASGVRLVIQVSALGADERARTPYHLSKKAADDFLAALPLRSRIVQPSLIYGPDGASSRLFRMMATLPCALQLGSAPQLVQPLHIDDACAAIVALLGRQATADGSADATAAAHNPVAGAAGADADAATVANLAAAAGESAGTAMAAAAGQGAGLAAEPARTQRIPLVGPAPLSFLAYLAALRSAMRLGPLRVLRLPNWLAHGLAALAAPFPGSPLTPDALAMLDRGNTGDPAPITQLLGHPPRAVDSFITDWRSVRTAAQLDWLLPLLRLSIALVWLWTAMVSAFIYPADASFRLLERSGIPAPLAPLMLYGASALDLLFGLGTLLLPRAQRRPLWLAQAALILFYTAVIALRLPEYLWHPYGPLSKNLPMLAALVLLHQLERR